MATQTELKQKEELTPTELKQFGAKVKLFKIDYSSPEKRTASIKKINNYAAHKGRTLYTGIHSENDWSRTRWWAKGVHLVNRTGEFAIIGE
jgi:hypothetical protein